MGKPDLLVFLSDQHHAGYVGYAGHSIVRTPHLDQLAGEGVAFDNAYTASPLCVPARVAMLTGQLPEKTGVYTNSGAIPGDQATFLHGIAAEGYETVLCGRMHFLGEDQRHGFTKRIMGEMTPLFWGRYGAKRDDLGPYVGTMAGDRLRIIGGGLSPVLAYDQAVIQAALDYLAAEHEKPQCIIVGTYGPHHTYVAPPELYASYREIADIPESYRSPDAHPGVVGYRQDGLDENILRRLRAAYFGMVTAMDTQVGQVRAAWNAYLERAGRQGVFVYVSDHGELAGEHGLTGKGTFHEGSAKIPMLAAGSGIARGTRVTQPVSLLDLGPTLCELAGGQTPPRQDGRSLVPLLAGGPEDAERIVVSETMAVIGGRQVPGRMLRKGDWKYIAYAYHEEHDQLFDIADDPQELHNVAESRKDIAGAFRTLLEHTWNVQGIVEKHTAKIEHYKLLARWGAVVDVPEPERWTVPEEAKRLPELE